MEQKIIYLSDMKRIKRSKKNTQKNKFMKAFDQLSKSDRETLMVLLDAFLIGKTPP